MTFNGVIIGFDLAEGESLKNLLKAGYSKPEKTDHGSITRKDTYQYSTGAEVERRDPHVFITVHVNAEHTVEDVNQAVSEVLEDFVNAGLLQ